ncbi:MAG: DUF3035 domain-containing protein [Pseudomonadota bacterium]
MKMRLTLWIAVLALVAAGCSRGDPELLNLAANTRTDGPDEFAVVPNRPLVIPENLASLPPPRPGAENRADANPQVDVVVALGGSAASAQLDGNLRADQAFVVQVTRYGVDGNIRQQLAEEDLIYRRANDGRLLERWFNLNIYFDAYEPQSLNQHAEMERLRRAGVATASAPPELP